MKMSVGEYYARKADMFETLTSGHDAGESQTQGSKEILSQSFIMLLNTFVHTH